VLRRFEAYAIRPDAPEQAVRALEAACRHCGRHIPEVLDSAVGWNLSGAPVHLVWEHAYDSPEAYRRYMVHPYHAAVLDRFLLPDSPERVVLDDTAGLGLFGYACDRPAYRLAEGIRRVVLVRMEPDTAAADLGRLLDDLVRVPERAPEMTLSAVGANTVGPAWFDGVTPITGPPRWTHVWEQGFPSRRALDSYLASEAAAAEPGRTDHRPGAVMVRRTTELVYAVGDAAARPDGAP
jgi:hypothetical protein